MYQPPFQEIVINKKSFKVIDVFAGAGGLGEGFASFLNAESPFETVLSIEKNNYAHATLLLRSFFRKFDPNAIPEAYFQYISGKISRDELFLQYPEEAEKAFAEVKCLELGKTDTDLKLLISERLEDAKKWILIGGPPCQAYSTVGRARMRSTNPDFEKDERHFLYLEYLKILAEHSPPIFLMENVKGILSATHSGEKIITRILHDLKNPSSVFKESECPGYRLFSLAETKAEDEYSPEDFLVKTERYGIPQARHRVLILGIRRDINIKPEILPRSKAPTVSDVISDLPRIRSGLSKEKDSFDSWLSLLQSVKDQNWYSKGKNNGLKETIKIIDNALETIEQEQLPHGSECIPYEGLPKIYSEWYRRSCTGIVPNHVARGHMRSDLHRYLFSSAYALNNKRSPQIFEFPIDLLPAHKSVNEKSQKDYFSDRFRVQLLDRPSSTVTSHIAKDGHYFIHYDPSQCRSLTVREAARIQTFPDSYKFEGPRTSQFSQVGNAVPPLLSAQVAEIIHDLLERISL